MNMAKTRKAAASKSKAVARKAAAKSAVRARAEKRSASKARAPKPKQKLKMKAHRAKQPAAAKALAKPKLKVAALKNAPAKAPPVKPVNKKEQRLAKFKLVAKKALEKVQAAHKSDRPNVKGGPVATLTGKKGTRGLTAREKALVKEFERRELSPADAEARRVRLKNLIVLGKERTYLTYSEINDHLPDDMMDAEQIENIIGMINDMGIQVYDEAPDADALLMSDVTPAVADEVADEEAEAALSTVDSEFGRTTEPVRMYMREMGSVELLTREGEIEIAKRIEDGLKHMVLAISACPTTIATILDLAEKIEKEEMRVDEIVDGLIDPNATGEEVAAAPVAEVEAADDDDDAIDGAEEEDEDGAAQSASLLKLKGEAG